MSLLGTIATVLSIANGARSLFGSGPDAPSYSPAPALPVGITQWTGIGASKLNGYYDNGIVDVIGGYDDPYASSQSVDIIEEPAFTPPSLSDVSGALAQVGGIIQQARTIFDGVAGAPTPPIIPAVSVTSTTEGAIETAVPLGAIGGAIVRLPQIVAVAIFKLWQRLRGVRAGTITESALSRYGARTWSQITRWVRANPGSSAIVLLTGLGLTVHEAAHFLAWGATRRARHRRRGVSARDLRNARRTMRTVLGMARQLRELCGGAARSLPRRRVRHRVSHA